MAVTTAAVADGDPAAWTAVGSHLLVGLQEPMPLFALRLEEEPETIAEGAQPLIEAVAV